MRLSALTPLILATLIHAKPAPAAGPHQTDTVPQCHDAVAIRAANAPHAYLAERANSNNKKKKKNKNRKPKQPKGVNITDTDNIASSFSAGSSRTLQVGAAVGLGVLEMVRLWG